MTDTTAGRGGVGIRVFIDGAATVRRGFDQIADSGKKMWAEIALGERSANPAIRALSAGAGEVKNAFDGLVSRAGSGGVALAAFGAAGMMAAAALGAVAIATHGAFDAMDRAADLTDAADRIGIGVEALQQWRYVADEAGVDVGKFEGALEKLNGVLGKFKLGIGDAKLKPVFEELGITKEQLDGVNTADQLLLMLADTLGQVKDRAQQVALARALGVEEALPAIRLGRDELERLTGAATELGLVIDAKTNAALDESQRKLEMANQQMRVARDVAVAPLADAYASVAAEIANMIVQYDRMEAGGPGWIRTLRGLLEATPSGGGFQRYISNRIGGVSIPSGDIPMDPDDPMLRREKGAVTALEQGGGFDPRGHTDTSAASRASAAAAAARAAARQAEREAEQRRQREERAQQQIERADNAIARSYDRGFLSIDGRAQREVAELNDERADRLREIGRAEEEYARSNGLRGLTAAEAELLRAKQVELTEQKKAAVEWGRRRDIAARQLQDQEKAAQAAITLLDIDAQMVRTNSERARIEREILQATIEISRKRRQFELENDPELSDADRRKSMSVFDKTAKRQVELFDHVESERLRAQFKGYGREVVDAIQQGRIGEYIGDKLKERLLDGALDQLFGLFKMGGGGGAGGGGGWLKSAFDFVAGGFKFGGPRAAGGGTEAGRFYTTVEHGRPELMMIGGSGHVTSAAETVRLLRDSLAEQPGGAPHEAAPAIHMPAITINAPGADAAALGRVLEEVRQLRSDMPGIAVRSVADARQRRVIP